MNDACRVYVVDDEPLIAITLAAILIEHGYEAIAFTGPLEVLAVVAQSAPAFLVSDVTMPGLTGIELAMKVLEHCPGCRVFLMTAMDSIDMLLEAAGAATSAFPLFHKPFHPRALLDAMESLVCPQLHAIR